MFQFLLYFVVRMIKENLIEIVRYNDWLKNQWNTFVDETKNGCFLFHRDFMEYHKDKFQDFSLLIYCNSELTAILPASIANNEVTSHKGLTYGGILVKKNCKFGLFKSVFFAINNYLVSQKVTHLHLKTLPTIYCEVANDELAYLHQFYGDALELNIGSVVYKNSNFISKSIIRNAKNALKKGIEIKKTNDFDTFWNDLLIPRLNERYSKKPIHTLTEIKQLKALFPDKIELVAAFLNNEMIAGTVLFKHKKFLKSQYIASKSSFNKLGGLDLLHFEILRNLKHDFFDFGTSLNNTLALENENLLAWKEQFAARTIVFPTYTFKITTVL